MTRNSESTNDSASGGCECLLILMFLGVAASVAIPSFIALNPRPNRSTFSEAKMYVGSMNRAQQAYFAEKGAFCSSVGGLGIGIKTETKNFKYSVSATKQAAFNYGVSKNEKYKSYTGGVFIIRRKQNNGEDEIRTESILCVADEPGAIKPIPPQIKNSRLVCGTGTIVVTK